MVFQQNPILGSGLLKLKSKDEVKRYLKYMVDHYQQEVDGLANSAGDFLRAGPGQTDDNKDKEKQVKKEDVKKKDVKKEEKEDAKVASGSWFKMGTLMINVSESNTAGTEILFRLLKEFKLKLSGTADALKSFEDSVAMSLPDSSEYTIYIRNGVAERVIVSPEKKQPQLFAFEARFRVT